MRRPGALQRIAAILVALGATAVAAAADLKDAPAPDFALKSHSGENLRLSEFRGEMVVLAFGASWCGDCRSQLEALTATHAHYRDAGALLLAVSLDQHATQAQGLAAALRVSYPLLHDRAGEVGRLYDVARVPFAVLIDRGGVVREVFEGYRRGNELMYLERVRALLSE